jgi:hypothetical protein
MTARNGCPIFIMSDKTSEEKQAIYEAILKRDHIDADPYEDPCWADDNWCDMHYGLGTTENK